MNWFERKFGSHPVPTELTPAPIVTQETSTVMAFKLSSILPAIGHFFVGVFTSVFPGLEAAAKTELTSIETSVINFAKTDLGKLAIDAVSFASALPSGTTDDAAFEAAKTKFVADAKVAGHDLSTIGKGIVDWMIQTAYTFTANVVAAASAAAPVTK